MGEGEPHGGSGSDTPMTWPQWIAAVIAIAERRGLAVSVSYPGSGLATFAWRGYTRSGVAGAGVAMFSITSPEVFTALWTDSPAPQAGDTLESLRRGRFVPRIPARAVSTVLQELFK